MTDRIPLDELNSDQLDALYDQLDAVRRMLNPDDLRLVDEMLATVQQYGARATAAEAERDRAYRDRDQAIAHDRQPYPTAWAYEQACTALRAHRDRADLLAATLGEALDTFRTVHDDATRTTVGYLSAPIHPDDMARWHAVLNPTKEQPMPTTDTPCTATIEGPHVLGGGPIRCTRKAGHIDTHIGPNPEGDGKTLWGDHNAGATPHQASSEEQA